MKPFSISDEVKMEVAGLTAVFEYSCNLERNSYFKAFQRDTEVENESESASKLSVLPVKASSE